MNERIRALNQDGWQGEPCSIDLPRLAAEQTERKKTAADSLSLIRTIDWNTVRHWLSEPDKWWNTKLLRDFRPLA